MAAVDDYLMLQYLMVFAVSIFFTALAAERKTLIPMVMATFSWLVTAILSFIYAPTTIGSIVGYMFGTLASGLAAAFLLWFIQSTLDDRHSKRYGVVPL